ncbi:MAG: hypothetical protein WAV07_19830 [Candidatus Contendobacter sp.]
MMSGVIEDPMHDFERRVALIHGLGTQAVIGVPTMDTQTQELRAMFASFLGESYSDEKILRVEALQWHLRNAQAHLARQLEQGHVKPAQYVNEFNDLLAACFAKVESVLGTSDFETLFGGTKEEQGGFIDKQAFLKSYRRPRQAVPR